MVAHCERQVLTMTLNDRESKVQETIEFSQVSPTQSTREFHDIGVIELNARPESTLYLLVGDDRFHQCGKLIARIHPDGTVDGVT